jgi:hypothetical protein
MGVAVFHSGQFDEAQDLVDFLLNLTLDAAHLHALPELAGAQQDLTDKKFEILSANMVGASVGKELKKDAIIAIVLALICIVIYIWWRFTFIFGIAATIATFHDVLAMLGIFYLLNLEMNILFITALLIFAVRASSQTGDIQRGKVKTVNLERSSITLTFNIHFLYSGVYTFKCVYCDTRNMLYIHRNTRHLITTLRHV